MFFRIQGVFLEKSPLINSVHFVYIWNDGIMEFWIPAFAGMTSFESENSPTLELIIWIRLDKSIFNNIRICGIMSKRVEGR
jgi:hypothetical protein